MDIHDYRIKQVEDSIPSLLRKHILNQHEKDHGVIIIQKDGRFTRTFGISNKELLQKSIEYYTKQENTKISWCYTKDIETSLQSVLSPTT